MVKLDAILLILIFPIIMWWGNDREKMSIVLEKYKEIKIIVVEKDKYEKLLRGELVW